ncbi:MAG TPA: hypothetical protein VFE32_16015 [Puia sp.]|jgi:hypothetical protein|nr:hypothetical protein [Puia sp.]
MTKYQVKTLIIRLEVFVVLCGYIVTITWIIREPKKPDPYVIFLFTFPVLADAIRRARKEKRLNEHEKYFLAYILTDPEAATRGVWLYPLHQQLSYRGYTETEVTQILSTLSQKNIIKYVEVPHYDEMRKQHLTAPAYKITGPGLDYIQKNSDSIPKLKDTYYYTIKVYGSQQKNSDFLNHLRDLDFVQRQTRFIIEEDKKLSRIALFAYKEIDIKDIEHISHIHDTRIHSFSKDH